MKKNLFLIFKINYALKMLHLVVKLKTETDDLNMICSVYQCLCLIKIINNIFIFFNIIIFFISLRLTFS